MLLLALILILNIRWMPFLVCKQRNSLRLHTFFKYEASWQKSLTSEENILYTVYILNILYFFSIDIHVQAIHRFICIQYEYINVL